MNFGKRYIMSWERFAQLPLDEPAGTQAWVEEDLATYYFNGTEWLPLSGGESVWIRSGNNTYMDTPASWEVEIGGVTYLWGNTTELQINSGLSVSGYINTQDVIQMEDNEVMRYDFDFGGNDTLAISTRNNPDSLRISAGNLGLGVVPQYKLDVDGDVNITGVYRVNGTPIGGDPLPAGIVQGIYNTNLPLEETNQQFTTLDQSAQSSITYSGISGGTVTLPDGEYVGQLKDVVILFSDAAGCKVYNVDGSSGYVNLLDAGSGCTCCWNGTVWKCVKTWNITDPTTLPIITPP